MSQKTKSHLAHLKPLSINIPETMASSATNPTIGISKGFIISVELKNFNKAFTSPILPTIINNQLMKVIERGLFIYL